MYLFFVLLLLWLSSWIHVCCGLCIASEVFDGPGGNAWCYCWRFLQNKIIGLTLSSKILSVLMKLIIYVQKRSR